MEKHILNLLQKGGETKYKNDAMFANKSYPLKNKKLKEKQFSIKTNRPAYINKEDIK